MVHEESCNIEGSGNISHPFFGTKHNSSNKSITVIETIYIQVLGS